MKKRKKIRFECDHCDGCGWYEGGRYLVTTCETCKGRGWIWQENA